MLISKIKKFIEENKLLQAGDRVIVAVSGGPDSIALLYILHNLSSILDFEISAAAHLNHCLRESADQEEAFVKSICANLDVPFFSQRIAVAQMAREQKMTLEDAGRHARYQFFNQLREKLGAHKIATAHHCDDVAETVLLHFLRGSGIKGLRGILPGQGGLIRPLLTASKAELRAYLEAEDIPYCLDLSNNDTYYMRNRIRHRLIPRLQEEFNPRIIEKLNQLALIARDENAVIEEECNQHWRSLVETEDNDTLVVNTKTLGILHRAYQRRIILQVLGRLTDESGWSLDDVEKVMELSLKPGSSLTLHLKKKVQVNKSYDRMIFTTRSWGSTEFGYNVQVPGRLVIPEIGSTYLISKIAKDDFKPETGDTCLDYDLLPPELCLRSRQTGDVFRPPGMSGSKKIKKLFIDLKVPCPERTRIPLLAGPDHEIFAVLGLGVSRLVKVNANTRYILLIKKVK
ncbi:MAG: tRNA lysidine(34) synthetase TilS [Syntrophomonadaceae bacterium]|nr:tRNA lysidine(34) synthetase TilS [Syntrophomonadaceae bacterium]